MMRVDYSPHLSRHAHQSGHLVQEHATAPGATVHKTAGAVFFLSPLANRKRTSAQPSIDNTPDVALLIVSHAIGQCMEDQSDKGNRKTLGNAATPSYYSPRVPEIAPETTEKRDQRPNQSSLKILARTFPG